MSYTVGAASQCYWDELVNAIKVWANAIKVWASANDPRSTQKIPQTLS